MISILDNKEKRFFYYLSFAFFFIAIIETFGVVLIIPFIEIASNPEIINDIVKFQVFLLTLRQYLDETKSEEFLFDWKSYFVDDDATIQQISKVFHYKNQITEPDPIKWIWEVVWFGHKEMKYKFNPLFLEETIPLTHTG